MYRVTVIAPIKLIPALDFKRGRVDILAWHLAGSYGNHRFCVTFQSEPKKVQ